VAAAYLGTCSIWLPRDEKHLGSFRAIREVVSERVERIAAHGIWKYLCEVVVNFAGCTPLVNQSNAGVQVDLEGDKELLE
jgi:hypothetical protein